MERRAPSPVPQKHRSPTTSHLLRLAVVLYLAVVLVLALDIIVGDPKIDSVIFVPGLVAGKTQEAQRMREMLDTVGARVGLGAAKEVPDRDLVLDVETEAGAAAVTDRASRPESLGVRCYEIRTLSSCDNVVDINHSGFAF